jgi:hypothetical protein
LGEPRAVAASNISVEHHHVDAFDFLATKAGRKISTRVFLPKTSRLNMPTPSILHPASISRTSGSHGF